MFMTFIFRANRFHDRPKRSWVWRRSHAPRNGPETKQNNPARRTLYDCDPNGKSIKPKNVTQTWVAKTIRNLRLHATYEKSQLTSILHLIRSTRNRRKAVRNRLLFSWFSNSADFADRCPRSYHFITIGVTLVFFGGEGKLQKKNIFRKTFIYTKYQGGTSPFQIFPVRAIALLHYLFNWRLYF